MPKKVLYSALWKYSKIKFYSIVIIELEFAGIRSPAGACRKCYNFGI